MNLNGVKALRISHKEIYMYAKDFNIFVNFQLVDAICEELYPESNLRKHHYLYFTTKIEADMFLYAFRMLQEER